MPYAHTHTHKYDDIQNEIHSIEDSNNLLFVQGTDHFIVTFSRKEEKTN